MRKTLVFIIALIIFAGSSFAARVHVIVQDSGSQPSRIQWREITSEWERQVIYASAIKNATVFFLRNDSTLMAQDTDERGHTLFNNLSNNANRIEVIRPNYERIGQNLSGLANDKMYLFEIRIKKSPLSPLQIRIKPTKAIPK